MLVDGQQGGEMAKARSEPRMKRFTHAEREERSMIADLYRLEETGFDAYRRRHFCEDVTDETLVHAQKVVAVAVNAVVRNDARSRRSLEHAWRAVPGPGRDDLHARTLDALLKTHATLMRLRPELAATMLVESLRNVDGRFGAMTPEDADAAFRAVAPYGTKGRGNKGLPRLAAELSIRFGMEGGDVEVDAVRRQILSAFKRTFGKSYESALQERREGVQVGARAPRKTNKVSR
jgi:hypothetical protein